MYRLGQNSIWAPGGSGGLLDRPTTWIIGTSAAGAIASRFLAKRPTLGKTLLSLAAGAGGGFLGWALIWLPYRLQQGIQRPWPDTGL